MASCARCRSRTYEVTLSWIERSDHAAAQRSIGAPTWAIRSEVISNSDEDSCISAGASGIEGGVGCWASPKKLRRFRGLDECQMTRHADRFGLMERPLFPGAGL